MARSDQGEYGEYDRDTGYIDSREKKEVFPEGSHGPQGDEAEEEETSGKTKSNSDPGTPEGANINTDRSKNTNDAEQQEQSPTPVGFWDTRLKHVRHEAFTKWCITTAVLMCFIIAALSLFWGALSSVKKNLSALTVYVVDFDGKVEPYNHTSIQPIVGPAITKLAHQAIEQPVHLGYTLAPPSQFNYDPIQVRQAVYNFDAWAALIINPNATALLHSAIHSGNTSYDPTGACQLVFTDSRDDTNWYDFISPLLTPLMTEAVATVGAQWTKEVMKMALSNSSLIRNAALAPQILSPAIGFSEYNLRPFYPYTAIPAVSIGLIYLIIISFFSFAFYLPIHFKYLKPEGHPPLKFWQLTLWRWCSTISAYFMLSLAYSFVPMIFHVNFSGGNPVSSQTQPTVSADGFGNPDAYGHGTFPVFWMLNFFGMMALGLACENVAMIVGQPWMGLWLIFWVISNVCTAFYDVGIEPGFYQWGLAWPLHSIVEGSRQILFDLHSRIGLDFGILIAWAAVNTALFPFACYFMRWKSKHHVHEYYR